MENYVVIITGANSPNGIGWASALEMAKKKPKAIYVTDIKDEHLPELVTLLKDTHGVEGHARVVDAANEDDVAKVVGEAVDTYGRFDVFFANAGIAIAKKYHEEASDTFLKSMDVNAWSTLAAVKHASVAMEKTSVAKPMGGGSIILNASVAGIRSGAGPVAYSASKAAVISIAQSCAWRLKGKQIRCNAVCPGFIQTDIVSRVIDRLDETHPDVRTNHNPLERYGKPEEIGSVVAFLASTDASFVNGQAIAIDGGLTAGHFHIPYLADC
ncbi:3-alpha--hydroxysteroid dehydrogenase [Gongronella butleri]|nr:3-alpha--hydroxysteroid dehydrogenase [Gongronella butleri]